LNVSVPNHNSLTLRNREEAKSGMWYTDPRRSCEADLCKQDIGREEIKAKKVKGRRTRKSTRMESTTTTRKKRKEIK